MDRFKILNLHFLTFQWSSHSELQRDVINHQVEKLEQQEKKQEKTIQEPNQQSVFFFLRNVLGSSATLKEICAWLRKTPSQHNQVKNCLEEEGVSLSKFAIKRCRHEWKYRGFTTRCKLLVTLKNRKNRLDFARRNQKEPAQNKKQNFLNRSSQD